MKDLTIKIPTGYEVDNFDTNKGIISFRPIEPKDVMERITSIDDVLLELGEKDKDVVDYRQLLKVDISDHIINNHLAILIAKALNEDWTPDWTNSNEYKYFPWFKMTPFACDDCFIWTSYSGTSARLCFKNAKLAEFAGKQFTNVYQSFMI